jgi:hypothetical protein
VSTDSSDQEPAEDTARRDPLTSPRSASSLDEVFGDVLPAATRDDLDEQGPDSARGGDAGPGGAESRRDDELRRNVPPHHG